MIVVLLLSKKTIKFTNGTNKSYVLLNGPSLEDDMEGLNFETDDIYVANDFPSSGLFFDIKPKFYVIADPFFFQSNERVNKINDNLQKVSWELNVFVPYKYAGKSKFGQGNKNIKQLFYNHYPFEGFVSIDHFIFDKRMHLMQTKAFCVYVFIQSEYDFC